jgi:hypothetical protein
MALRIRKNGCIFCAALHGAENGDTYVPDNISEVLTGCTGEKPLIISDPEPIHSTHGRWWWANQDCPFKENNNG